MEQSDYLNNRKKISKVKELFTHLRDTDEKVDEVINTLQKYRDNLVNDGIDPETITINICCSDPDYPSLDINWEDWESEEEYKERVEWQNYVNQARIPCIANMILNITPDNVNEVLDEVLRLIQKRKEELKNG